MAFKSNFNSLNSVNPYGLIAGLKVNNLALNFKLVHNVSTLLSDQFLITVLFKTFAQ